MEAETEIDLRTDYRRAKDAFENTVYDEWTALMSVPGAMMAKVEDVLMEKHGIGARSTIWAIRKRVEKKKGIAK